MSEIDEDTVIAQLANALVTAAFKVRSPKKRACVMSALEDVLAVVDETPPRRGRRRRRSRKVNGPEAEPVGPHPDV
jgi:hypothetical protein